MSLLLDLVPGLYLAVLVTGLVAALRRWFDPIPGRIVALFVVLVVVFLGKALFLGGVLLPLDLLRIAPPFLDEPAGVEVYVMQGDLIEDFAPYQAHVRRTLKDLEWPLLNELVGLGEPLLANSQAQHFHPLLVLTYPLPLAQAVVVVAALKILFALVFTFLLLRRLGIDVAPAAMGACGYGFGGFTMMYLGWPHTHSAAALPLLLWAFDRALVRGGRRDLAVSAAAVVFLVLGGHPETIVYAGGTAAVFALARPFTLATGVERRRRFARLAAAAALGALSCAPVVLPAIDAIGQSERRMMLDIRHELLADAAEDGESDGSVEDRKGRALLTRAAPLAAPFSIGSEPQRRYWGDSAGPRDLAGFAGTALLLLALSALWPVPAGSRLPLERTFGVLGLLVLLTFVQPPGLTELIASLPVLSSSASLNRRAVFVAILAIAYLAAAAWQRLRRGEVGRGRLLVSAGVLAGILVALHLTVRDPRNPETLASFRTSWLIAQLTVAGLVCGAIWFDVETSRRPVHGRAARSNGLGVGAIVPLVAALELLVAFAPYHRIPPKRLFYPPDPAIQYVQENLGDGRIVGLDKTFRYNVAVLYGIADLRSGNPLQPATLSKLTRPLRPSLGVRTFSVGDDPRYDLLGVRMVLTEPDRDLAPLELAYRGDVWVWKRESPLPAIFLPTSAEHSHPRRWTRQIDSISDFAVESVVAPSIDEPASLGESGRWRARTGDDATVEVISIERTRLTAEVTIDEPRLLVAQRVTEIGWRLLVDGRPTPTVTVDGALAGAWLPAGSHRVEWIYRPPGFLLGCLLAAVAAAALGAWLVPLRAGPAMLHP